MARFGGRWGSSERAQLALDFLAGMAIFLVTVGFVLSFVPGMFQPFESDNGPRMVVADRSAALLVEDLLIDDDATPGNLNDTCTAEFFDGDTDVGDCPFDDDASDLDAALGIADHRVVNVTIQASGGVRTLDGGSIRAAAGPPPASTANVLVAKRVVLVEGKQSTLLVRVW